MSTESIAGSLSSIFSDVSYEASRAQSATSTDKTSTLNQDDFLALLTTQLQNQDPLSPMEDTDFIAQMANFTSLEQTKGIAATVKSMSQAQQTLGLTSYLGKEVTLRDGDDTITGEVESITSNADSLYVVVNGKEYLPTAISSVSQSSTQTSNE